METKEPNNPNKFQYILFFYFFCLIFGAIITFYFSRKANNFLNILITILGCLCFITSSLSIWAEVKDIEDKEVKE